MTDLGKNDSREFMGLKIEGDRGHDRYRRQYTPKPIEELYPYFQKAFADGVKAATWHQYTPYFNDGEPCEFSVYDLCVTNNQEVADYWLEGDFYEDRVIEVTKEEYDRETSGPYRSYGYYEEDGKYFHRFEEGTYDYIPGTVHPDNIKDVDIPVSTLEFEDALRNAFGDHTQVVVTPERVVQFEYEHE